MSYDSPVYTKPSPFGDDFLDNPLGGYQPESEPSPFDPAGSDPEVQYRNAQTQQAPAPAPQQAAAPAAPAPVETPAAPTAAGGIRRVSFGTTLSLDVFGLRFSSGNISREYEFATLVDENTANEVTEYLAHIVVTQATEKVLGLAAETFKAGTAGMVPAQSAGAGYAQLPAGQGGAPAGAPTGNIQQQATQLLAGDATGQGANICKVFVGKDDKGNDEFLYFPHPDAENRTAFQNRVKELAQLPVKEGGLGVHPTQIMVFDNREDLLGGKKAFSAAKIVISQDGNADALAEIGKNRAIAWVKCDRLGKPSIAQTRDFKNLDVELRVELKSPAIG